METTVHEDKERNEAAKILLEKGWSFERVEAVLRPSEKTKTEHFGYRGNYNGQG